MSDKIRDVLKYLNCKWCNNHVQGSCMNECETVINALSQAERSIRKIVSEEVNALKLVCHDTKGHDDRWCSYCEAMEDAQDQIMQAIEKGGVK